MQQAIAIFDSGVGGLTVVKQLMKQLPQEKIIYFGDTARAPYGPRQPQEVAAFAEQIVEYLIQFDPKLIVIACNTATAVALENIRNQVPIPVIGVIHPGAREAVKRTRTGKIGVIGTEGTIQSGAYVKALKELSPDIEVVSLACPLFVPLVEKGRYSAEESLDIVRNQLSPLLEEPIDCLILGCTHYPFLQDVIGEVMGTDVQLISSAEETAREVSAILYHRGQLARSMDKPKHHFYCSGDPRMFEQIARQWLGMKISAAAVPWQMDAAYGEVRSDGQTVYRSSRSPV